MNRKILTTLVILLCLSIIYSVKLGIAQKVEEKIAKSPYSDPKGYFRILPPEGWKIKEYPDDPRGKVAFIGPAPNIDLRILASVKNFSTFEELFEADKESARKIERFFGTKVIIEKTTFLGRPAVKRTWIAKGIKFLAFDFMVGNVRHDLQYGAPLGEFDKYLPLVMKSMETYEPLPAYRSEGFKEHQIANKKRLARLFLDTGDLDLALLYVKEGLEIDPYNQELLNLKREVENKKQYLSSSERVSSMAKVKSDAKAYKEQGNLIKFGDFQELGPYKVRISKTAKTNSKKVGYNIFICELEIENIHKKQTEIEIDPKMVKVIASTGEKYGPPFGGALDLDIDSAHKELKPDIFSDIIIEGKMSVSKRGSDSMFTISKEGGKEKWFIVPSKERPTKFAFFFIIPKDIQLIELHWENLKPFSLQTSSAETSGMYSQKFVISKDKVTEVSGIHEYVGKGEVYFEKGEEPETLKIKANGKVEIINGRICYFCLETIRIAPQLKVPISIFVDTEFKELERIPFKVTSVDLVNLEATFRPTAPVTKFIISGPKGATLKKIGKGFLLLEGEAWLVVAEIKRQIKGILFDSETEKPITKATVFLIPKDIFNTVLKGGGFVETVDGDYFAHHNGKWVKAAIAKTKTDDSGAFSFTEIPPGEYGFGVKIEKPLALGIRGIPLDNNKKKLFESPRPLMVDIKMDSDIIDLGGILIFFEKK